MLGPPPFIVNVLKCVLELRTYLKHVAETAWLTSLISDDEVKNLRLREQVTGAVNICISHPQAASVA